MRIDAINPCLLVRPVLFPTTSMAAAAPRRRLKCRVARVAAKAASCAWLDGMPVGFRVWVDGLGFRGKRLGFRVRVKGLWLKDQG
jgi:hypothetical protein